MANESSSPKPDHVPVIFQGRVPYTPQEEGLVAQRRVQPEKVLRWVDRVNQIRQGRFIGPVSIHLHLANACQHNCSWCAPQAYRMAHLTNVPEKVALSLLNQAADMDVKNILLIGGGEPTVNPAVGKVISAIGKTKMKVSLTTNGGLILKDNYMKEVRDNVLSNDNFTSIRISLDAFDCQTHDKYHRPGMSSDWYNVLEAIEWIGRNKKPSMVLGVGILIYDSFETVWPRTECATADDYVTRILVPRIKKFYDDGVRMIQIRPAYTEESLREGVRRAWYSWERVFNDLKRTYKEPWVSILNYYSSHMMDGVMKPRNWKKCGMTNLQTTLGANGDSFVCCAMAIKYGKWYRGEECKWRDLWMSEGRRTIEKNIDVFAPECASCTMSAFNNVLDHSDDYASETL